MDYVLFGMGYGATLMLLGWALRTFGPDRKYKNIDPDDVDRSILQRRWIRFIQGLGGVISIAGTAMVVFTFVIMLVNPDDGTGSFIALVSWGFLAFAILIWCWFYVSSFGALGIWSRDDGYGFRSRSTSRLATSGETTALSTSRVVPKPRISDRTAAPDIGPTQPGTTDQEQGVPTDEDTIVHEDAEVLDDHPEYPSHEEEPLSPELEAVAGDESDPEYDFGDSTDTTVPSEIGGRTEAIRRLRERQARSGNRTN